MIRLVASQKDFAERQEPPLPARSGPGALYDLAACYRYCEALARARHHNFPVASQFLPARLRPHVLAVYAFARKADDFADEPQYEGRRDVELDRWEDLLHRCYHGEADHPIFIALADTAQKYDLPITPLLDLLAAFRMDLERRRYATFQELTSYLSLSAKPVGRMLFYIFGYRDAERHRYAEELALALALTGLWQGLARDAARGRVYIPQEDLRHFGVSEEDLFAGRQTPALAALVHYECARARAVYERARPLIDLVADDLGVEVGMIWHGGRRALAKVDARAGDVFGPRAALGHVDKAYVLGRALARRGLGLLSRL